MGDGITPGSVERCLCSARNFSRTECSRRCHRQGPGPGVRAGRVPLNIGGEGIIHSGNKGKKYWLSVLLREILAVCVTQRNIGCLCYLEKYWLSVLLREILAVCVTQGNIGCLCYSEKYWLSVLLRNIGCLCYSEKYWLSVLLREILAVCV